MQIEPGETVILDVALRNAGAINTNNLTAALLSTGGSINLSAAQNYGTPRSSIFVR